MSCQMCSFTSFYVCLILANKMMMMMMMMMMMTYTTVYSKRWFIKKVYDAVIFNRVASSTSHVNKLPLGVCGYRLFRTRPDPFKKLPVPGHEPMPKKLPDPRVYPLSVPYIGQSYNTTTSEQIHRILLMLTSTDDDIVNHKHC